MAVSLPNVAPSSTRPAAPRRAAPPPAAPGLPEPRPDRLLKWIGFLILMDVWRIQDAFPFLGRLRLPMLTLFLTMALFAADKHPWRRLSQLRGPILNVVLALFVVMLLGVPFSLWRGQSVTFVYKEYVPMLVLMGLIAASVRSMRDIEYVARVNLWGGLIYSLVVALFFRVGADGRLGDLVYYDANDYALVSLATIPFALYFLSNGGRGRRRTVALIALFMYLVGIVKSGSRGGFIALIVLAVYVLLRYRAIPARVRLTVAVAGIVLVAGFAGNKYWDLMDTMVHPQQDYNWSSDEGRLEIWKRGLSYVEQRPVLGVGVRAYPIAEGLLSEVGRQRAAQGEGWKWSVAHNSFLETAVELGVLGGLLFIGLFVVSIHEMSRLRGRGFWAPWVGRREMALAQMLIGSFLVYAVAGFFLSAEYFEYLYVLLGLAIGMRKLVRLRRTATLAMADRRSVPIRFQRATPSVPAVPPAPPSGFPVAPG